MKSGHNKNAYAVWKIADFRWLIIGRFFMTIGIQMQSVIVGWQVYELTKDPFSLGLIGLAEVVPFLALALFAGHVADKVIRKNIIVLTTCLYILCAFLLLILSYKMQHMYQSIGILPLYLVIAFTGIVRAFFYPAQSAYMAQIVPKELYPNSSTWNSIVWHIAAVTGPAIGGLAYGFFGIHKAYMLVLAFASTSIFFFLNTRSMPVPARDENEGILKSLADGIRFVLHKQALVGSMALDMFGVLFGGAVALLPVFAAEVLKVGPQGLGVLRAAPAIGAVCMSMVLAYFPPVSKTGYKLFAGTAGFGICMIAFAISRNFWLSLSILIVSGMFDNISVVIRSTILQLYTPDAMRGRVASVNSIFIGSSNELGSFESGLAARLLGLIPSVIFGGGMTLLVVTLTMRFAPVLRKMEIKKLN
ncbi:MAG: MFS transporter [Bacteroidetes bacterium]|nr:MFS transporter [Bacteroidota bacterium]